MLVTAGAGLAVALAFAFWHRPQASPPEVEMVPAFPAEVRTAPAQPGSVTVHVSGAVADPGLVVLVKGSRAADAIAAAGGGIPGSNLGGINLAALVTDGMQLVVPWIDGTSNSNSLLADDRLSGFPVDLNRAGVEQLTELPGVGEVLANRILAHREEHGPFTVFEDLLDVPGIGERKLAGLRDYAVVNP